MRHARRIRRGYALLIATAAMCLPAMSGSAAAGSAAAGSAAPGSAAADGAVPQPVIDRIRSGHTAALRLWDRARFAIGCSVASPMGGFVTFIRQAKGPVLLALLSNRKVMDVRRDFSENPSARDWALVFDRNRDGRIDQMVVNIGPLPLEPDIPPPDLPNLNDPSPKLDQRTIDLLFGPGSHAFWQALDTAGQGSPDTLAFPARRKSNGWYSGWVVTSTAGGAPASCRFVSPAGADWGTCRVSADGKSYAGENQTSERWVDKPDVLFTAVLHAAATCKLAAADFIP